MTANLSAATRYVVALRGPIRNAKVPMVRDASEAEIHELRAFANFNSFAADLTDDEVAALRRSGEVRYVEPVHERHLVDTTPSTVLRTASDITRYNIEQTIPAGVAATHAPDVWPLVKTATPVNVVIIDTGIDATHPELADNYAGGFNTFDPTKPPVDDHGHGTHVAGIVAAADNTIGVIGMAPKARIWSVKALDKQGNGTTEGVIAGLDWLLTQKKAAGGRWVASLSLGSTSPDAAEQEAFQRAYDAGVLAVAAAGNTGAGSLDYPGGYPTVLSAGAVDDNQVRAVFSSYGPNIGIMAPGVKVLSTARVGSITASDVQTDNNITVTAYPIYGSPKADVWAPFVYCGIGRPADFPPNTSGHIAFIQRGCGPDIALDNCDFTFNEKVKNAIDAGARAVVIFSLQGLSDNLTNWTLVRKECDASYNCNYYQPDVDFPWILATAMSYDDAQKLLNSGARTAVESYRTEDYMRLSGTSMATPHISGGAALIWSLAPTATAQDVRNALLAGARDLGDPGYDAKNGFGMLDVLASAKLLAPQAFGLPTPTPAPKRRP